MPQHPVGVEIDQVIQQLKDGIDLVQRLQAVRSAEQSVPAVEIEKIDVTLKAYAEQSGGGEIELKIPLLSTALGAGMELRRQETQTIKLTLVPQPAAISKGLETPDLKSSLVEAILSIEEGIRRAAEGEPPFEVQDASAELNFVVGSEGQLALVVQGKVTSEMTQTVKLHLKSRGAQGRQSAR